MIKNGNFQSNCLKAKTIHKKGGGREAPLKEKHKTSIFRNVNIYLQYVYCLLISKSFNIKKKILHKNSVASCRGTFFSLTAGKSLSLFLNLIQLQENSFLQGDLFRVSEQIRNKNKTFL